MLATARSLCGAIALAVLALALSSAPAGASSTRCCVPFQQPGQLAMSDDGQHLYVADNQSTLALRRDPASGALTLIDSYDGGGGPLELSPDGRHLYVISDAPTMGPTVHAFKRDAVTGALSYVGRWSQTRGGGPRDIEFRDDRTAYMTDELRDALMVFDRDPATGRLDMRSELRNGQNGVEGLATPDGIEVGDGWLYVNQRAGPHSIGVFRLAENGDPRSEPDPGCDCSGYRDLELMPDGRRLLAGPFGPYLYDRDPATGRLADRPQTNAVAAGGDELADGTLAIDPGGAVVYGTDWWANRLNQYDHGGDGIALRRSYYEGRDGQGINRPRSVVLSPDGRHLYLAAGSLGGGEAGTVSAFRRDPASGELSFASLYRGPVFDGRPHHLEGQPPRLLINGGDEYTNDPDVMLSVEDIDRGTFALEVSNDGGFKKSERRTIDETNAYPWTLASSGPERLPKTVYARLSGMSRFGGQPITDEIVLDERAPTIVFARQAKRRLDLKARDDLSGVSHVQATRNPKRPGRWRRFAKSVSVPGGRGRIHVRVRDRANNRSRWRVVGR
jgi:6-phosphogluconolactonase (cycloisomerase 2 family)